MYQNKFNFNRFQASTSIIWCCFGFTVFKWKICYQLDYLRPPTKPWRKKTLRQTIIEDQQYQIEPIKSPFSLFILIEYSYKSSSKRDLESFHSHLKALWTGNDFSDWFDWEMGAVFKYQLFKGCVPKHWKMIKNRMWPSNNWKQTTQYKRKHLDGWNQGIETVFTSPAHFSLKEMCTKRVALSRASPKLDSSRTWR